jgi:spectinomycin phosphotransferase
MLAKPDLDDEKIIACLRDAFELHVVQIEFLPLGADRRTAVYRVVARDRMRYFLKLRSGAFDETSVTLPKFLNDQGIGQILAPLPTKDGQLWAKMDEYALILCPFVQGDNAYSVDLTDRHWIELGSALKRIHTANVPREIAERIPLESFSSRGREVVMQFLEAGEDDFSEDPVSVRLVAFLEDKRAEIVDLVARADRLARALAARPQELVVCHSDLHAGNILIAETGEFYMVDWDDPIRAAKERDLMFVGGGQFGSVRTPQQEEDLFYRGYGQTEIDPLAMAYYRYERIVQDIAAFSEQICHSHRAGQDREQGLGYLMSNFLPNNTIDIAYRADRTGLAC